MSGYQRDRVEADAMISRAVRFGTRLPVDGLSKHRNALCTNTEASETNRNAEYAASMNIPPFMQFYVW